MKNINEDKVFCYTITPDITNRNEDPKPKSFLECQNRNDWFKQKDIIQDELNSLNK